ncbi:MAG: Lipopolysaccharide export system ATP-binding protein LptB [Alphaproteobacteria bacterium MarineAlpha5_Bin10]|nr:MAG: Lipopolysaccharide export system ATP-binding protein LptB [Alphaproteobacteria bacterium MarineAlpha5_Bin10]|tara:strand:- start:1074 stop:1790 length:717 start_codon:yes stop_codon:yes gene_type:complete
MQLACNNITVDFSGLRALDKVSLSVKTNEILGLIGPNGSGKTTLLNVLGGQLKSNEGSVTKDNLDITIMPPRLRVKNGLARSFQIVRTFDSLSVFENVKSASLITNMNNIEKNNYCDEIINYIGLNKIKNELANTLNFGDRRRLEIARAMATNPDFLLLDEPAAGMNDNESEILLNTLNVIPEKFKVGILIIDHDMSLIMKLCHRLHVLESGKTIAEGSIESVKKHPEVIKAYLGKDF